MSVDDSKLNYSSTWEIDQLLATDTISVVANVDTPIFRGLVGNQTYEVQFKPTGQTRWYLPGTNSTTGLFANSFSFYTYSLGNTLYLRSSISGTSRFHIWQDKIDY